MLQYPRIKALVFTDTFFAKKKQLVSTRGNTCCQVFVTEHNYVTVKPMVSRKAGFPKALKAFFKEEGVPPAIIADGAKEQVRGESLKLCQQVGCEIRELEQGTPFSNRAERYVGILKERALRAMKSTNSPMKLWDYCIEWCAKVLSCTAHEHFQLEGMTPKSKLTGQPTDISNLCEFGWYEWVQFRYDNNQFPEPHEHLGRCLGPADHAGRVMSQCVLNQRGNVLPIQTLRKLRDDELSRPSDVKLREDFDESIRKQHGTSINPPQIAPSVDVEPPYQDLDGTSEPEMPEADDIPDYDQYVNADVLLPQGGEYIQSARVVKRVTDDSGKPLGDYNPNPLLDTRVYEVMFGDGSTQQFAANVIAENLWAEVDDDGYHHQTVDCIIDHKSDDTAIKAGDEYYISKNSQQPVRCKTTKGWFIKIQWKDGTTSWKSLKDVKESVPVQLASYATDVGIQDEPAFSWWVPYTLRKRDQIISAVNRRMKKRSHKYGIRIPTTIKDAYRLDNLNGNSMWRDAIRKEMRNASIAFDIQETNDPPQGYIKTTYHMIFDVKMDFTRKARIVADGHKMPEPSISPYAGVVSRDTVRIAFTYAALNDLDVCAADIKNAYLQAPNSEKHYIICGPEFGTENLGKVAIVVRALYGGKVAGANFRNHLRDCMEHLGYQSCLADPDLWMKVEIKPNNDRYWHYVLLYVDDMLSIGTEPKGAIDAIGKCFQMKPDSIGQPNLYLGGKVSKVKLPNGVEAWAFSSSQYVQAAVKNVEEYMDRNGMKLKKNARAPFTTDYRPEIDGSEELNDEDSTYFQSLIGILRWIVELGRIDIGVEASMLASCMAMPRKGNLHQLFHVFAYLKNKHNARLVFDPSYPDINLDDYELDKDWTKFYGNVREAIPENAPEPLGKEFIMRAYVDADHAGDKLTRRSRTGYIVFLNMAPIYWLSKKQTSIETSSFGSEFIAMKQCCEFIRGLRYKLRMMGIPVNEPTFIRGDNKSVLNNTSIPSSVLAKKSNSIAYHAVREGVAKGEWVTGYIRSESNPSNILTKSLPAGAKRDAEVSLCLYDI